MLAHDGPVDAEILEGIPHDVAALVREGQGAEFLQRVHFGHLPERLLETGALRWRPCDGAAIDFERIPEHVVPPAPVDRTGRRLVPRGPREPTPVSCLRGGLLPVGTGSCGGDEPSRPRVARRRAPSLAARDPRAGMRSQETRGGAVERREG